jgi:hypothetical protein
MKEKNDKHLFYKFIKAYKLLKNQNHCIVRNVFDVIKSKSITIICL